MTIDAPRHAARPWGSSLDSVYATSASLRFRSGAAANRGSRTLRTTERLTLSPCGLAYLYFSSSAFSSEVADSTTTRTPWIVPVAAFLTASPAASLTS